MKRILLAFVLLLITTTLSVAQHGRHKHRLPPCTTLLVLHGKPCRETEREKERQRIDRDLDYKPPSVNQVMTDSPSGVQSSGTFTWTPEPTPCYEYEPKEDITTYELARLIPYLTGQAWLTKDAYEKLGSAQRHLKKCF